MLATLLPSSALQERVTNVLGMDAAGGKPCLQQTEEDYLILHHYYMVPNAANTLTKHCSAAGSLQRERSSTWWAMLP